MARIYLVRHGESVANTEGRYQGITYDTSLSELGKKQAGELAKRMKKIRVKKIVTSPLTRTRETAETVARFNKINVELEKNIIETNHGLWEGEYKDEIAKKWPHIYKKWQKFPSQVKFPGGEHFLETQKRIITWWKEFIIQNEDTLVVSHDNIIRIIIARILNMKLNRIWKFHLQPTAITLVEINSGFPKLKALNDSGHLKNLQVNLEVHAL